MRGRTDAPRKSELRSRAEKQLKERESADPRARVEEADITRLLHELRVHQVELEMQNEELQSARQDRERELLRYTELFDFAPIGYFALAGDGTIRELNLAGARLLGQVRERIIGGQFRCFFLEGQRKILAQFLSRAAAADPDEPSSTCELTLVLEGGVRREVRLTATSLKGEAPGVLCAVEDITDRRHAEDALRDEIQHRDTFLATLSHELRNPLAPIVSSLYILERAVPGEEQAARARDTLGRQVAHLSSLLNDLLDITRVTRNRITLRKERLDLNEIIRGVVEDNRSSFEKAAVDLQFTPAPRPVYVLADRTRISQAVGNLLQNAAKFSLPRGKARVSVGLQNNRAVIRIADDGTGMTTDTLAHLFQPFTQAGQALDRSKGGLGLGLALAKGLIELHGGTITAHSDGLGRGSEFVIRLAEAQEAEPKAVVAPMPAPASAQKRILIIEDNVDAAETLKDALTLGNHEVAVAYNGPDGIAEARSFKPDVVLCDIGLPGMDGYEVARFFRTEKLFAQVFLVALSGYAQPEDLLRAKVAGFDRHVAKPANLDKLEEMLSQIPA